jgi:hypothetical protein
MLDTVPVWFEIWRQLNGFPPTIDPSASETPLGGPTGEAPSP